MFKYITLAIKRDGFFLAMLISIVVTFIFSGFAGSMLALEQAQASAVYTVGFLRVILVFSSIIFPCFFIARLCENKETEFLIASKKNRDFFIISIIGAFAYFLAQFCFLSSVLTSIFYYKTVSLVGVWLYFFSLFLETLLVLSFAVFISVSIEKIAFSVIFSIIFYILSRTVGFLSTSETQVAFDSLDGIVSFSLMIASVVIPRADLLLNSKWILYGVAGLNPLVHLQIFVYFCLIFTASVFDFRSRQF